MLKKIVVASVLSSVLGVACFESEGMFNLEDALRAADPAAGAAAAGALARMRYIGRVNSIDDFGEYVRANPGSEPAVARYIATYTDGTGNAINGHNYERFLREMVSNSIQQGPDGNHYIDPMALDSFRAQSGRDAFRAARRPSNAVESQVITEIRNTMSQLISDALAAFAFSIQDLQNPDPLAQQTRDNLLTNLENEIRSLFPMPGMPAAPGMMAPGMMPMPGMMPAAQGMPNPHVATILQAVRDVIQQYIDQPGNQQYDTELESIIGVVTREVRKEIRDLTSAPGMMPGQDGKIQGIDSILFAVRDAFQQYIAQGNQQNNQAFDDMRNQVLMPFETEIQNPQTQDPHAQMIRNMILANHVERGHATIADLPADVQNMLRDALDEYNRNHGTNIHTDNN